MKKKTYLIGMALIGLMSCQNNTEMTNKKNDALDLSARDTTVNPADNFFEYANGAWLKGATIPDDKVAWGSFHVVRDQALDNMKSILEDLKNQNAQKGSNAQKVGDLYASALDTASINAAGITPIQTKLDKIKAIDNSNDMLAFLTDEYKNGNRYLFSFYVSPDDKNSNLQRPKFMQSGLGLPNKNYYFDQSEKSKEIRATYQKHVTLMLELSGWTNDAEKYAQSVFQLETKLAKASKTPVERRVPEENYHLLSVDELNKTAPNFQWKTLLGNLGVNEDTLLVGQPEFYKGASTLLSSTSIDVWQAYLTFHLVKDYANWLSTPFADAHFNFYNRLLQGQKEKEVIWKRAASLVNGTMGEALGELYVQKYFPPEAKEYMVHLVENLQKAYEIKINEAEWLSEETKQKAVDKLHGLALKIGYPDKWKDYSSIEISRESLIANLEQIGKWQFNENISKLGKPVDKSEWFMTPPTVNAYYNSSFNEIVFPAGILQPPFYFQHGDDAVNYGAIGFVIGHEITHGFDDRGSQYDKDGNLNDWWSKEEREKYNARAERVVQQYNQYTVLDSVKVNGKLTLGENIADIGGLAIAYAAFKATQQGQSDEKIDGLTPDQRFFMSAAQVWRMKTADERMLWRINNDSHSPEVYRVNGPLSNMESFYQAFDVKEDNKMYRQPKDRIKIW